MRTVRMSLRNAEEVLRLLTEHLPEGAYRGLAYLAQAIDAARPKRSVKLARSRKAAKKRTKKQEAADIRGAVMKRADGRCECGCGELAHPWDPLELDHFRGRGRSETVESCWALRASHHKKKTLSEPSAAYWLKSFINHARYRGFDEEAAQARRRLAMVEAKEKLAVAR